ncbi:Similar to RpI135: DNA-directed RNA polymerase I subunit RPA2 (Drosophila melanogaster), partial [Cotesia congregata]
MVEDKAQMRSTGPVDVLTQQPIKGRRRGGDRLFHCSDKSIATVCRKCGSLLGPVTEYIKKFDDRRSRCKFCNDDKELFDIDVPYIFRYLVTELASLNIKVKLDFNFNLFHIYLEN